MTVFRRDLGLEQRFFFAQLLGPSICTRSGIHNAPMIDVLQKSLTVLQLGLLKPGDLPIAGIEVARKVVDPFGQPSNTLLERWKESEGLPLN